MRNKKSLLVIVPIIVLWVITGVAFWNSKPTSGTTNQEAYRLALQSGLAQLNLTTTNNLAAINSANENLSTFIYTRSGVQLTQSAKNLMKDTEERAWAQSRRITPSELSQILADAAIERLANSTEAEVNQAAEALRGFTAPDLPSGFVQGRNTVRLRANGEGTMTVAGFITDVNSIRNSGVEGNKLLVSTITNRTALEVERRVKLLSEASPEAYGNLEESVTPMQAILIAYSIVADDPLTYNDAGLQARMESVRQGIAQTTGQSYPSPEGHRAFGTNGYLYSSPANLLFNEATVTRILNSYKGASGIQ